MAALPPVGAPTDPLNAPSLSAFATAIRAALDGSDVSVDTRLAAVELTPGPPGVDGIPGPQGDPGPAGPPGTAYLNAQWDFNQTTTVSPNAGTMRMNATTYAATTTLWVHESDRDGLSRIAGLDLAQPGDQIIMQSAQGRAVWQITTHADSGAYRTLVVTLIESSGTRPSAGSKTTLYFATVGTTAAVILSGTATPTGATGNVGDYYLDTDDQVLYGPKLAGEFGSPVSGFTSQVPATETYIGGFTYGLDFLFAVAGRITTLRYHKAASGGAQPRIMKAWSSPTTTVATATIPAGAGPPHGWRTVTLGTPLAVAAGQTLRVSMYHLQDDYDARNDSRTPGGAITNGPVSILDPGGTYYSSGDAYPTTVVPRLYFFDVVFEPGVSLWPVALKSIPPGGTTGQYLKKTSNADYAAAWVT